MNATARPLQQALDLNPADLFAGGSLILVHEKGEKQEPPIDGSFILQLLISEYYAKSNQLQPQPQQPKPTPAGGKVLLVLTHQTEKHWNQCCGKFGQNLDALKNAGHLAVIDTLKLEHDRLMRGDAAVDTSSGSLAGLLDLCTSAIDTLHIPQPASHQPRQSVLIVIENLTSLFLGQNEVSRSGPTISTVEFLRTLRTYRHQELDICLAALVKSNIHDNSWTAGSNRDFCQSSGNYMANLITECFDSTLFEISPLSTGYSDEINGKVNLKPSNKSYHFKIEDRTVKFVLIA